MTGLRFFPKLLGNGQSARDDSANEVRLPARSTVFHQGDACSNDLLIIEGSVKVISRAENGREIVLYRLDPGDSWVLTMSCLFGSSHHPADGIAESAVVALAIPTSRFQRAVQASSAFRSFVLPPSESTSAA